MDPFTERILERARERQKKLLQSKDIGSVSPLGESNSLSTTSLEDFKSVNMTPTVSDSMLCTKSQVDSNLFTETQSEGNLLSTVRQNSKTRISSNITGSPQSHLKTLNIQRENFNMEIKLSSTENVRVEVEFHEENDEGKENIKHDSVGLRDDAKMRLERLGRLYAGGEDANISSPIHQTEAKFVVEETPSKKVERKGPGRLGKGLGALNTLAQDINEWEDDLSTSKIGGDKPSVKKKSWKPPAPRPPISSTGGTVKEDCVNVQVNDGNSHTKEEKPRQINLDPTLVETLESQGFTRTVSNSRLVYNYNKKLADETKSAEIRSPSKMKELRSESIIEEVEECGKEKKIDNVSIPLKHNLRGNIANKTALFEANANSSPNRNAKDPALLSLSERKALFEKNKGEVLVPKASISMAAPVKPVAKPMVEKRSPPKYLAPRPPIRKADVTDTSAFRVTPGESGGIASKVAALFKNKSTISQQQIENEIKEQRQKEMDILLHRFNKNKAAVEDIERAQSDSDDDGVATETTAMISKKVAQIVKTHQKTPSPPPLPPQVSRKSGGKRCSLEDSPKVAASLEDVKRIKVSPAKPGKLYPCLSDIEAVTETETEVNTASTSPNNSSYEDCSDSDGTIGDTSFGREVLETVCKNASPPKRPIYMDSTESDMSDILDEMDDYLDEALAYDAENGPTPPKHKRSRSPIDKGSHSSSSFQYKNCTPLKPTSKPSTPYQTPIKEPSPLKSDESPAFVVDGDDVLPLTHTVSFYRKQQIQGSKTPVRQVIKYPAIQENSDSPSKEEDVEVKSKICSLVEEVTKQQTIISQTSQALNLCYSTPEFTGSTEQVEAEKVLLLATHKRAAAQREIERLSVLKTLHSDNKLTDNIPLEKGKLVISNIVLPLKRDYVRALNATGGKGHHVLCLIKSADQVYSTQLVSTVATNDRNPNLELSVPGTIHFNNIYSNFTAQFEVYCLQAQNESLPHDVKYHINKKGGSKVTPKKGKSESRLIRPPKESPGGPQAVRSPTFALMGYVVFSIQATKRKNWTLNNAPSMSPLEGIVEMRVKCEFTTKVEHHGFLTMFEDISGFGAWHRRWCMLKEHSLSYWKYPDDEKKKLPIDTLDLSTCITTQVGPVRRDICARLNTFLIETKRPVQPHDKDSLVMQCNGDTTIIRHLLSADTKEERNEWCTAFNKALATASMLRGSK